MAVVGSMPNHNGRDMHPFFMSKAKAGHPAETDFDLNDKRRKRQRTNSTESRSPMLGQVETNGWINQLNAAAAGAPLEPNAIPRSDQSSIGRISWEEERRGGVGSNLSLTHRSRNGSPTDLPPHGNADMPSVELTSQPSGPSLSGSPRRTPQKKMLRVRPDGRLGSPRAKAPAQNAKPRRGRKSAKAETAPKTLLASIRYGTDAQSRSSVGRKIANIFSGTASNPSRIRSTPNNLPELAKPTHPFFLGGTRRDQCQKELVRGNDDKESAPGDHQDNRLITKRRVISPSKARVTSKPPGVSESSTSVFGLGGNTFRADRERTTRIPGALEALWPPEGMVHIRENCESAELHIPTPFTSLISKRRCKRKEAEVRIPKGEQTLTPYVDIVQAYQKVDEESRAVYARECIEFRRPLRRIMTGHGLQEAVRRHLASKLPTPHQDETNIQDEHELGNPQMNQSPVHPAVRHVYQEIATSLTAFDKFECETQDWVHKYTPACADQVLQPGREALILRDWIRALTINSVDFRAIHAPKTRESSVSSRRATTKRKRRRAEELDGFILSSDEEADELCQVTDSELRNNSRSMLRKSAFRSRDASRTGSREQVMNAVVISGPHGCGKTAAVHAIARELGFEVFEINPGSRRSGKDILDKVGDMTRNHLVKHPHSDQGAVAKEEAETTNLLSEKLKHDLASGRQGTMNSFFKSKETPKKSSSKRKGKSEKQTAQSIPSRKHQSKKQSLILLEDVDVLFDEDKAFWATTLELLVQSKRPVIMTCADESMLPLDDMDLHAILRFTHAPEQLAIDYLLLVACNEGHLLSRGAVLNLYKSKGSDLRASMTELNFSCQMAVGDTKGGLEWILSKTTSMESDEQNREPLRVVSEGTYQTGMGWLSGERQTSSAEQTLDSEIEMYLKAWQDCGVDVGACEAHNPQEEQSRTLTLQELQAHDQNTEAYSAADIFPGRIPSVPDMVALDTAQPELTEKARSNFVEGYDLLQADPVIDQTGLTEAIAFAIKACARQVMQTRGTEGIDSRSTNERLLYTITKSMQDRGHGRPKVRSDLLAVFEPIARSCKPVLGIPKGPQISTFDGSLSVITEDLAPYVRSIVSYDLRLEERRRRLGALLSQPGKTGERQRRTRASRAALEGSNKAQTRRERWFPENINFDLVLQSGGEDWQDIALKRTVTEPSEDGMGLEEGSRRGSLGSAMGSDA